MTVEEIRLEESRDRKVHWKRWGPYLSERAWGTVREDYSAGGSAWEYLPHDHARSRAYRWNEDGLAGICDRHQRICFALALWNGRDPILKERLFGLTGNEGNHGEDVKECYYYLDSTPTHSYMKFLYKYPQAAFPYEELVRVNRERGRGQPEYELIDTGVFGANRYFDITVEYAKATDEDILIRIQAANRGGETADLHVLPTLWFRNRWSWNGGPRPQMQAISASAIELEEEYYGKRWLVAQGTPELLFTENDTNAPRLFHYGDPGYFKDGINDYVVGGRQDAVNPAKSGTKAAAYYRLSVPAGGSVELRLRFTDTGVGQDALGKEFADLFEQRLREADEFYHKVIPQELSAEGRNVMRQSFAGLLWSKQYYHYVVDRWLKGDTNGPPPPPERINGRNHEWTHLYNADVLSMPDKWEYPWYASWDLAFHCVPLAVVDP
ncbi:MAG: glucosidase, partial [Acidobacteriota bacterium]|nr:glucosidase [Acidobacteriota bacterium]